VREPAAAYVRVYCGTLDVAPVYEVGPVDIHARDGAEGNDFWRVATVESDGVTCRVTPLRGPDGGADIVTAAEAQGSR
jgi:hypothetical protein